MLHYNWFIVLETGHFCSKMNIHSLSIQQNSTVILILYKDITLFKFCCVMFVKI